MPRGIPNRPTLRKQPDPPEPLRIASETASIEGRAKFRELANKRGREVIRRLRQLSHLGAARYDPTPEMVEKLIETIELEFNNLKTALRQRNKSSEIGDIF